jgi:hypothetical protein
MRFWNLLTLPLPVPGWLPELAESVAVKQLDIQGRATPVPVCRLVELRQQFEYVPATNFYVRWAKWFFAERGTRARAPFGRLTAAEPIGGVPNSEK